MVVSHENALMLFSNLSLVAMSYYMMMAAAVEERTGYRHDLVDVSLLISRLSSVYNKRNIASMAYNLSSSKLMAP
jgi:hypothetical protein